MSCSVSNIFKRKDNRFKFQFLTPKLVISFCQENFTLFAQLLMQVRWNAPSYNFKHNFLQQTTFPNILILIRPTFCAVFSRYSTTYFVLFTLRSHSTFCCAVMTRVTHTHKVAYGQAITFRSIHGDTHNQIPGVIINQIKNKLQHPICHVGEIQCVTCRRHQSCIVRFGVSRHQNPTNWA